MVSLAVVAVAIVAVVAVVAIVAVVAVAAVVAAVAPVVAAECIMNHNTKATASDTVAAAMVAAAAEQ